jgi:hypothetical protein
MQRALVWVEREEKSTDIAVAMASIFDKAIYPKQGCDAREGLVQWFLYVSIHFYKARVASNVDAKARQR